jgi:hypothetical protein
MPNRIITHPQNDIYASNWERIFSKKPKKVEKIAKSGKAKDEYKGKHS